MIAVTGAAEARALAQRLRAVNLRSEAATALRAAAPTLIAGTRRSAIRTLPGHGGLDRRVARSRVDAVDRSAGDVARLRITATADMEIDAVDAGLFHHPVFGRGLVTQRVPPGWFTGSIRSEAPAVVARELNAIPDRIARRL